MKYFAVSLFAFCIHISQLLAQYFDAGTDPASVKWNKLKTPHFQFIYPVEMDSNVQKLASYAEYAFLYNTYTLKAKPKQLPIILHNRTVVSNGFLAWAPSRSEYYTCPDPKGYAQNWLQQLMIHEFRHALQLNRLNTGTTKVLSWIFGEQGTAAVSGLYLPLWYLEGDAVLAETALSPTGRGRFPSFDAEIKAQLVQKGMYSYDKAYFGSYRDHVPNRYIMGYHLVSQARINYGKTFWDNVEQTVARNPWMIVPFNYGISKQTNLSKTKLYRKSFIELDSIWKAENKLRNPQPPKYIAIQKSKYYTSYQNPVLINDSIIIAEKRGKADISSIVLLRMNGKGKRLITPGLIVEGSMDACNYLVVWAEIRRDSRWEQRSYSIIRSYDLRSRKTKTLTHKSRYFTPAVSKSGDKIAVTEVDLVNRCYIVELNSHNGKIISRTQIPDSLYISQLTWNNDNLTLYGIATSPSGKTLIEFNSESKQLNSLLPWSFTEINSPIGSDGYVYFTGAYDGTEQIYALNRSKGKLYQLTHTLFGATQAFVNHNQGQLLFSDYTSDGYKLAIVPIKYHDSDTVDYHKPVTFPLADTIAAQEEGVLNTRYIQDTVWKTSAYRRGLHLFRIHSWGPFRVNAGTEEVQPGFSIQSQNNLSTAITTLGYKWDHAEKSSDWFVNFTYKGWYPVLELETERGKRNGKVLFSDNRTEKFYWYENRVKTSVSLPLKYQLGKFSTGITSKITLEATNYEHTQSTPEQFRTGWYQGLIYQLSGYYLLRSAELDLSPRFGQSWSFYYSHTPFGNFEVGNLSAIETQLFLPGLFPLQRTRLYAGYQHRLDGKYYYSDQINYPRGYNAQFSKDFVTLSANYKFPLAYPDYALGGAVYIKRVKANLFYDFACQRTYINTFNMNSAGIEITSDMHLFRLIFPADLGFRLIYLPTQSEWKSELIFSMNFNSL